MNKMIHAIWLGEKLTPLAHVCIDDWKKQGYTFKLWTEKDPEIIEWIELCEFTRECYQRKLYAFVSDYLRLKVLQHSGGLYLDTDVTIQKNPFELFSGYKFVAGYESEGVLGTAVIYAEKDSTILESVISFYEKKIIQSNLYMGPGVLNYLSVKCDFSKMEKCAMYDVNYFYNYKNEAIEFIKPNEAYLTHWFQYSWKKNKGLNYLKSKHLGLWGRIYVWQKGFFRF